MTLKFRDRTEAGRLLATRLAAYADRGDVSVLALPRGGVPVAYPIAQALRRPLDVWLVRKLGVPGQKELAMGAIASNGVLIMNDAIVQSLKIPQSVILQVVAAEQAELERREQVYRRDRPPVRVHDQTVILVDDGIATGSTLQAAVAALKPQLPSRIVVAVPVAPPAICKALSAVVDEVICLTLPDNLNSIGQWYQDFAQTSDEMVCELLAQSATA